MNEMRFPLVSIVITSYNRADWIRQAIESSLAQDYANLEIIISDNCSTDNSDEVIRGYCHDPRIRYSRNETNIGMLPNFNKAFFELAKGDYIVNVSSDDYLTNPTFISKAVDIINRHENISIVFGMHNTLNEKTQTITPSPLPGKYDIECKKGEEVFFDFGDHPYYSAGGAMYSLKHLKENNIRFTGRATGDVEMNLQMMLCGNIGFINEVVYMTRMHGDNASAVFKTVDELENMYLDLYSYIYKKADLVIKDKPLLKKWYKKLIFKNIRLSLYMVLVQRNRKQLTSFNSILLKKYREIYLLFLAKNPVYIGRIIFNR